MNTTISRLTRRFFYTRKEGEMKDVEMREKLEALRDFIWMRDIPHPTIPEYREWHENIQAILKKVDALIEEVANENGL